MFKIFILLIVCISAQAQQMSYLENGKVKIGIDLEKGGAITFLSAPGKKNMINNYDLGRQIQMSFYSGPVPFSSNGQKPKEHWKHLGWNPIQSGDDFDNPSRILEFANDDKSIYVKSTPMQWPLDNVPGDCTFESWISLKGRVVEVKGRLTNNRNDRKQYRARHQELPAVYVNADYYRLFTYKGEKPFTEDELTMTAEPLKGKDHWHYWNATENWAAYADKNNWGLGVWHPGVNLFAGGFKGKIGIGGTNDVSTGYIAPIYTEILDHNIVYNYKYFLILGPVNEIRHFVYKNSKRALKAWDFSKNRQHWYIHDNKDTGWPLKGGMEMIYAGAAASWRSPKTFWKAEDAPFVNIVAEYKTSARFGAVAYRTLNGKKDLEMLNFEIKQGLAVYKLNLKKMRSYKGSMSELVFYPLAEGARVGDSVKVSKIWFSKK